MKPLALITTSWDDGHPLDMRLAERLAHYGIPATFYIPFSSERPVLEHARIRELAAQFEIGAHTISHADLRTLSPGQARQEIVDSKRYIEDITGASCRVFAPPGGKYERRHVTMVRKAGFAGMRTVELMSLRQPARMKGLAVLPTTLQFYPHSPAAYLRNAARRFRPGNWITSLTHAHGRPFEQAAGALSSKAEADGGVFHLWGHSWELEEKGLWSALEATLRLLHARAGNFRLVSNGGLCLETFQHEHLA
jgi:peptidoglycan/xylan/chitin deacetylase (PgdA/CDA1 family)